MRVLLVFLSLGVALADNMSFLSRMYHEVADTRTNENVIMSTVSIKTALGLVYMGAEGVTAQELHDVLELPSNDKEVVGEYFSHYLYNYNSDGAALMAANRIYLSDHYDIAPQYKEITFKYFKAEPEKVDFSKPETVTAINSWIEQQTNNKIKNMLSSENVNAATSMVLVNAIYFKANWKYPFKKEKTVEKDFHIDANQKVPVKMMIQTMNVTFFYLPELDARAIELPYDNINASMRVFLPNKVDGLAAFQQNLKDFDFSTAEVSEEKVHVRLPKFKVDFGIKLNGALENMGLRHLFSNTEFSMTTSAEPLQISEVIHKAFIEVDEQGAEAAASTVAEGGRVNGIPFIVDHPFFFTIEYEDKPMFSGHVSKF